MIAAALGWDPARDTAAPCDPLVSLLETVSALQAGPQADPDAALAEIVRAAAEAFDTEWAALVLRAASDVPVRVWAVGPNRRLVTSLLALSVSMDLDVDLDGDGIRLPIEVAGPHSALLATSRPRHRSIGDAERSFARALAQHARIALHTAMLRSESANLRDRVRALEDELARSRNELEVRAESFSLTGREAEVLRLLARGLSNRDIARSLFVSESTAKFHVANIMRKLEVRRRAEAVYVAGRLGAV